jgi:ketosteroid isomerase-like protein
VAEGVVVIAPDAAIRARRAASNAAIASRDADATVAVMLPDITVAVAGGPVLIGRPAQRAAFAEQFADRAFRGYVRTPDTITLRDGATHATERGSWVGRWQRGLRTEEMRGTYVAEWRLVHDAWMLHSEIYT